ncbi:unnamed protein product, partial [Rotaria magnacalcarata]
MNQDNSYTRHYTSKRKPIEHNEVYQVIVFPCDNSFSVVKAKQCTPSEQDGFMLVHSGGKKYVGFVLETGSFQMCTKAADLLSQKQHDEIESDYERGKEAVSSKDISSNVSEKKTFTSLTDVPFTIDISANDLNECSPRRTFPNLNLNHVVTPIRGKLLLILGIVGWQRTRNECCPTTTTSAFITCTDPQVMPLSSSTTDSNLILTQGTTTINSNSNSNVNVHKRSAIDSFSPLRKKKINKSKKVRKDDDESSADTQSDDENAARLIGPIRTPTFNGRRLVNGATTDSTNSKSMDNDNCSQSMEKKIDAINQVQIQKALNKRQIPISLEEPTNEDNDDTAFPSSLPFKPSENAASIDLLKVPGTKDKANLYVTSLIQLMYTMEELVALTPTDNYDDNRYKLIQEAVRCKFKLTGDQLQQLFNEWLRG